MSNKSRLQGMLLMLIAFTGAVFADDNTHYNVKSNIAYYGDTASLQDQYCAERCVLDIYYPTNKADFSTVVWFHGGGIEAGNKYFPKELQKLGFAIIAVNYRLSPKVNAPIYIEDAAAAIAWSMNNIEAFGGDPSKVVISGHSAGGYLVSMVGLDKAYLDEHGLNADQLAGIVPFSGHTITHFTIRKERGIKAERAIVDQFAPLYHVRKDAPPLLLITGDRELELLGRYEENAYLARMMKVAGHGETLLRELQGFDHGTMVYPAFHLLAEFVSKLSAVK